MKPISIGSRARSIGIPSSATTTRNCPRISTTRNTFQFRTRESSILASLWSWISLVTSCPSITTKFATSSAEEVLTADTRICWCGGAPSVGGTISRTSLRRRLCGSGARRTGSNSARPEVTLLLLPVALTKARGTPEPVQLLAQSCTDPSQKGGLTQHVENCGTNSSNPPLSCEESAYHQFLSGGAYHCGRLRHISLPE